MSDSQANSGPENGDRNTGDSQSSMLVALAGDRELFHDAAGDTYGRYRVDGHYEVAPINSRRFRRWLSRQFYNTHGSVAGSQAMQAAVGVLEGMALHDGPQKEVYIRLAQHVEKIYLDLCNERWQVVEIDAKGWRVLNQSPVMFRRPKAMLPLPTPTDGGTLADLRQLVNVADEEWPLILAWLVAALRPSGPYPILGVHGEQGSAKSTLCEILRSLIDPNQALLRSDPRQGRDLMIAANNGWVLAFDNLSYIYPWLSDALCRLSTGGGFSTRTLYENDEETIFNAQRPIILNGIEEVAIRSDLLDRCLLLNLPRIEGTQRRTDAEMKKEIDKASPRILGALLTALSMALKQWPKVKLPSKPRMADFAEWATAAEPALGLKPGDFMVAYNANLENNSDTAIEASPVGAAIVSFIERREEWSGTATELLSLISITMPQETQRSRAWPKNGRSLSGYLKRLAPNLRNRGVGIDFNRTSDGRTIRLWRTKEYAAPDAMTQMTQFSSGYSGNGHGSRYEDIGF